MAMIAHAASTLVIRMTTRVCDAMTLFRLTYISSSPVLTRTYHPQHVHTAVSQCIEVAT